MGKRWRNVLLQGTLSVHYGLVNDRICSHGAQEGVFLTVFPGGCRSNLVILSRASWRMLHNTSLFHATDMESSQIRWLTFTPIVLSKQNEKWTVSTSGMCFWEACSDGFTVYITFRCCLASPWRRERLESSAWSNLSLKLCVDGKQAGWT